jgi:hypothetical protein
MNVNGKRRPFRQDRLMIALLPTAAIALSPQPASGNATASDPLVVDWSYQPELIPDDLVLKIQNRGSRAICMPRIEVEGPNLLLFQDGKEVEPIRYDNRATLVWRGDRPDFRPHRDPPGQVGQPVLQSPGLVSGACGDRSSTGVAEDRLSGLFPRCEAADRSREGDVSFRRPPDARRRLAGRTPTLAKAPFGNGIYC